MPPALEAFAAELRTDALQVPVWWEDGHLRLLDQTDLPHRRTVVTLATVADGGRAIRTMQGRGAGALGTTAAYGVVLAALVSGGEPTAVRQAGEVLAAARPTAATPARAVSLLLAEPLGEGSELVARVQERAMAFVWEQRREEVALGAAGAALLPDDCTLLTYCHAGALAGTGYGGRTVSVVRQALRLGKRVQVIACETRPYFQGSRITAWEFQQLGVPVSVIADNAAGYCLQRGMVDAAIVGSDRVAMNGDVANKVGTYPLALACADGGVPFYVATSRFHVDPATGQGAEIPIEVRSAAEVLTIGARRIAPRGVPGLYPAFDVTPARLVTGIITAAGVLRPPYAAALEQWLGAATA